MITHRPSERWRVVCGTVRQHSTHSSLIRALCAHLLAFCACPNPQLILCTRHHVQQAAASHRSRTAARPAAAEGGAPAVQACQGGHPAPSSLHCSARRPTCRGQCGPCVFQCVVSAAPPQALAPTRCLAAGTATELPSSLKTIVGQFQSVADPMAVRGRGQAGAGGRSCTQGKPRDSLARLRALTHEQPAACSAPACSATSSCCSLRPSWRSCLRRTTRRRTKSRGERHPPFLPLALQPV